MEIQKTTDYGVFKFINGNREVDQNHVNQIIKSMERKFLIRPIDVTSNMEIIDGQHRFSACEFLKLPIYYVVHNNYDFEDVHILNQKQKNWTCYDFVKSYAQKGNKNYILLLGLIDKYSIPVTTTLTLIKELDEYSQEILRNGELDINEESIRCADNLFKYILEFKPYVDFYKTRNFICAIKDIVEIDGFDKKRLLRNVNKYNSIIHNAVNRKDMIQMLEGVYNYRSKINLRFY